MPRGACDGRTTPADPGPTVERECKASTMNLPEAPAGETVTGRVPEPVVSSRRDLRLPEISAVPHTLNRMLRRPMTSLVTVVLWVVGLLVIWTVCVLLYRLTDYLWRPEKTAIGEFVVEGQANPSYAAKFQDRWLSFRSTGQAVGLLQGLPSADGADFILAEVEERSTSDLERTIGDLGKELDLKVAGISLPSLARFLDSLSRPAGRIIEGRLGRFGNEVNLTITLKQDGHLPRAWSSYRSVAAGAGAEGQQAAEEDLIDEAICEVALYLRRVDRPAAANGDNGMADTTESLSARAYAELKKGRRSLERYAQDNHQDDLLAAQQHFRSLVASSPAYTDGYLLLSQTLAENRQEREAIEVYDRAIRLLSQAASTDQRRSIEARFLKASSLLRCYRWADVVRATAEFRALARDLDAMTARKPGDRGRLTAAQRSQLDAWREDRYMLARTHAETAHCLGHMLVLLPKDRSIRKDFLGDLVSLFGAAMAQDMKDPDDLADRRALADRLYAIAQDEQKQAKKTEPIYKQEWKADLSARLNEVTGYAQFRHAEWLPAGEDKRFRTECNEAVRTLQDAELRKPRHYALLQNIGMVYLSRRYDPKGDDLDQAERYYARSLELKPSDYFGHAQLGLVGLRRALIAADGAARGEIIKAAQEQVARALQLRSESQHTRLLRCHLRLVELGLGRKAARVEDLDALQADIEELDPDGSDVTARFLMLACGWLRLQACPDEAAFDRARPVLKSRLEAFSSDLKDQQDAIWRVAQMRTASEGLARELETLTFAKRLKPRFAFDAAID